MEETLAVEEIESIESKGVNEIVTDILARESQSNDNSIDSIDMDKISTTPTDKLIEVMLNIGCNTTKELTEEQKKCKKIISDELKLRARTDSW